MEVGIDWRLTSVALVNGTLSGTYRIDMCLMDAQAAVQRRWIDRALHAFLR